MTIRTFLTVAALLSVLPRVSHSADEKPLPSRDPEIVMPFIMALDAEAPFGKITTLLGEPDRDMGSGIHMYLYKLADGTYLRVGTGDRIHITYIDVLGNKLNLKKRIFPPGAEQPAP